MPKKMKKPTSLAAAMERAELYFTAHPGSPSAVRRPSLIPRSGTWVATLGKDFRESIVGLGATVEAALRAFDRQYLAALRPPETPRRSVAAVRVTNYKK
jgi:hypothetical protein